MNQKHNFFQIGIKVLDLADEKASFCSKLLADVGAHVIKIEPPGGDPSRKVGPYLKSTPYSQRSLLFEYNNMYKQGITLDLEQDKGKKSFVELVKTSDVMVETFPPGYLNKLKLDFGTLSEINPRLILASVSGFGRTGPLRENKSCDLVASAVGGQMHVTGSPYSPPLKNYGEQSYYSASLFAAVGILLALRRRRRTGKGEHIDISLQEAVNATLEHVMVRFFFENSVAKRQGSLHWNHLFHIVPCKDGFIQMTLFQNWNTLVEWMDSEGMAEDLKDEKWNDEGYRLKNIDHIVRVIGKWTKIHTRYELFHLGQLMRFPWAPVQTPEEILECPHLEARGFIKEMECCKADTSIKYPRFPARFNPPFRPHYKSAPLVGEDNEKILGKGLNISKKEMVKFSSKGVI